MKRLLGLATVLVLLTGAGARAECYPPDPNNGAGHVDKSRVAPGECVTFSGNGFRPSSTILVDENGNLAGTAKANNKGEFSKQVCFASDAEPGQHELHGTGPDKGGDCGNGNHAMTAKATPQRTVTATVYVLGVGQVAIPGVNGENREDGSGTPGGTGGTVTSPRGTGGLPFTGDITFAETLAGLVLLLGGTAVLIAARPRRRRSSPA